MFHIVQAVVHEELELRNDAQLFAYSSAEFEANLLLVDIDVLNNLLSPLAWKDTEIYATYTQVRANAASTDTHQNAPHRTCLLLEDVAQLLLYEASNLVLSGCFQNKAPLSNPPPKERELQAGEWQFVLFSCIYVPPSPFWRRRG